MLKILHDRRLIAILRGLTPQRAASVGQILYRCGWRVIEVPLNSPQALRSITILRESLAADCVVGAGTVLQPTQVDAVADAGGEIIVSPNTSPAVISRTKARDLLSLPGVFTPSEAFIALENGADALKYFPCEALPPAAIKAQRAILPTETTVLAVGGITADNMAEYYQAGVDGFGFGSALFTPTYDDAMIAQRASTLLTRWRQIHPRS